MSEALHARFTPLEALAPARAHWLRLMDEALEPNPFYAPDFLLAGARHLERPGAITALSVWRGETMLGLLPLHRVGWRAGLPLGTLAAYTNPYTCQTTPLVARDAAPAVLAALLGALDEAYPGTVLALPMQPLHRPLGRQLTELMAREGRPSRVLSHYGRALLAPLPGTAFNAYIAQESADLRKSFRRREARLNSFGTLDHRIFADPGRERAEALERFLMLEATGWKGRHRTALASRADTAAFIRAAFAQEGALGYEIERLSVDSTPLAMSLNLVAGGVHHTFKQAYDETWRPYAPGKLLDRRAVARAIDSDRALVFDSCGMPGHPVDGIWHERLVIGKLLVGLGKPCDSWSFEAQAARALRRQGQLRWARQLRDALRRRLRAPREAG